MSCSIQGAGLPITTITHSLCLFRQPVLVRLVLDPQRLALQCAISQDTALQRAAQIQQLMQEELARPLLLFVKAALSCTHCTTHRWTRAVAVTYAARFGGSGSWADRPPQELSKFYGGLGNARAGLPYGPLGAVDRPVSDVQLRSAWNLLMYISVISVQARLNICDGLPASTHAA
jgi:hypothetical protein